MSVKKCIAIVTLLFICGQPVLPAELSSKSRKAEKLAAEGNIKEATAIYQELMAKDKVKNAALVKEGREGYAKLQLTQEKEALKNKQYGDAEKLLKEIMTDYKDTPSFKDACRDLVVLRLATGGALFDGGKYDTCAALMEQTKADVPADTDGLKDASALNGKALFAEASGSYKAKDYSKALDYLSSLKKLQLPPSDPVAADSASMPSKIGKDLLDLAESETASAKYENALKDIELALSTNGDDEFSARAGYLKGKAERSSGQPDKASVSYKGVLDNHKTSSYAPQAAYDLYLIAIDKGDKSEALAQVTAASNLKPDSIDYQMIRAGLLNDTGAVEEAKKIYLSLVDKLQDQIDKTYTGKEKLQHALGEVYMRLESYPEAAVEFDKAVSRDPSFIEARRSLAQAQFKEKSFAPARQNYEILIKQASADYDKSLAGASKTNEPSPETSKKLEQQRVLLAYYHYQNGLCLEQLGDYEKAEQECRLGLEGVSTKEAAATMKRVQKALADKQAKSQASQSQNASPSAQTAAPAAKPEPASAPAASAPAPAAQSPAQAPAPTGSPAEGPR